MSDSEPLTIPENMRREWDEAEKFGLFLEHITKAVHDRILAQDVVAAFGGGDYYPPRS